MTKTARKRKRAKQLFDDRNANGYDAHWLDIVENLAPNNGRYLQGIDTRQYNDGRKKYQKIINSTGTDASRVCYTGLNSGMTPHWSPWFNFTLPDEDLMEYGPVKDWLHKSRNVVLTMLSKSNFYSAIYSIYQELVWFGTASMIIEEDLEYFLRCCPLTIGEYAMGLDSSYRPESLYRRFQMTAGQCRDYFGKGKNKMENLPEQIRSALLNNDLDLTFEITHALEKNEFVHPGRFDYQGMPYASCYFLTSGDEDEMLREQGYRERPFVAPRWETAGRNTYGTSPGMAKLGDIRQLQQMERDKLEALRKMIRPPMNAPASMKSAGGNILSGAINFLEGTQGTQGFVPAYQVNPNFAQIREELNEVQQRIKDGFFVNMFLAVLGLDKREVTAYEVAKRYEEKATVLGPIMERLDSELRSPVIERIYGIAMFNRWLPSPPQELPPEMEVKVEYISSLSQAQKVVQGQPIQEFVGFVGQMMAAFPTVGDKIDADEVVDQLGQQYNVPPKVVRSDDAVIEIRSARQKQQQMQMMMENAKPVASAVKDLSQAPTNGGEGTALDGVLDGAKAANGIPQ